MTTVELYYFLEKRNALNVIKKLQLTEELMVYEFEPNIIRFAEVIEQYSSPMGREIKYGWETFSHSPKQCPGYGHKDIKLNKIIKNILGGE